MPRNGSGVYSHPFPDVVEGTTIESAVFNGNTSDVEQDLNTPRPIVAGGTGASNARDAMINLNGEIAMQLVDNYDMFPFVNGSFWSTSAATGTPPPGYDLVGECTIHGNPAYATLEARAIADVVNGSGAAGTRYVRHKRAGVWDAWVTLPGSSASLDAAYVNVAGDVMTGRLEINFSPALAFAARGKENPPSLNVLDAYAVFHSNNGGYGGLSIGGRQGPPYSAWMQSHNSGGIVVPLEINAVAGDLMLGSAGASYNVQILSTTASTSPTTGALTVAGGVGVAGRVTSAEILTPTAYISSRVIFDNNAGMGWGNQNTALIGHDTGGYTIYAGGVVAETIAPGAVNIYPTTPSTSPTTGALTVAGGVGVGGALYAQGACSFQTTLNVAGATNLSSLATSGNVTVVGTLSVGGAPPSFGNYFSVTSPASTAVSVCVYNPGVGVGHFGVRATDNSVYIVNANATGAFSAATSVSIATNGDFKVDSGRTWSPGYQCRSGNTGAYGANLFNLMHNSGPVALWIDNSNLGNITVTSDYRIKKDVIDLPGMWDTVKALRPIKYTQAQFSPPSHVDFIKEQVAKSEQLKKDTKEDMLPPDPPVLPGHLFEADDIERWGFIAHELQDTLPSMAEGVKDSPDTVQSLNLAPVVAALTKALQEAMTRIEALEGGAARRR